ncbi:MAG: restriction endonuclease [Ardenticatenaceae bacterium]|nr:restriction endonuclease [Ardenticatenaceae bacterium]MCB9442967.1 restriction endonuclease [Ardenticatenaceae bacterium]
MKIGGVYSFKGGEKIVNQHFPVELQEIKSVIAAVNGLEHKTKKSFEKTMPGKMLYKPRSLNKAFSKEFEKRKWQKYKVACDYPTEYYTVDYVPSASVRGAYREMDFVKNRVGVEVQFGKYAFMVYNVCAKMTIFHNQGVIDVGVEIVPLKELASEMSTGVSYFEQFVWDLEHRGVADIDIPVLILGITV